MVSDDPQRRLDFGRIPSKTMIEKRPPKLPVLGPCEGTRRDGQRCRNDALYRWRDMLLCGVHHTPKKRLEEQTDVDRAAYRDHHVVNYHAGMMMLSDSILREIVAAHASGTVPGTASVMERLRLEARGLAAARELDRRAT